MLSLRKSILSIRPALTPWWDRNRRIYEVLSHALSLLLKQELSEHDHDEFEVVSRNDHEVIFFAGHGDKSGDRIVGCDFDAVIDTCNVNGHAAIYAVACRAADNLGKAAVNVGASWFWGYCKKVYLIQHRFEYTVARLVMSGLIALIQGQDLDSAWATMVREHEEERERLIRQGNTPEWSLAAGTIDYNLESLRLVTPGPDGPNVRRGHGRLAIKNPVLRYNTVEIDAAIDDLEEWAGSPSASGDPISGDSDDLTAEQKIVILRDRQAKAKEGDLSGWEEDDNTNKWLAAHIELKRARGANGSEDTEPAAE
jgi:hypothetical protein